MKKINVVDPGGEKLFQLTTLLVIRVCICCLFYSDADINVGKALLAEEQYRLEGLLTEQTWFNQFNGLSIDLDQAFAFLAVGNCDGIFLPATKGEM